MPHPLLRTSICLPDFNSLFDYVHFKFRRTMFSTYKVASVAIFLKEWLNKEIKIQGYCCVWERFRKYIYIYIYTDTINSKIFWFNVLTVISSIFTKKIFSPSSQWLHNKRFYQLPTRVCFSTSFKRRSLPAHDMCQITVVCTAWFYYR